LDGKEKTMADMHDLDNAEEKIKAAKEHQEEADRLEEEAKGGGGLF
jgi:hypothetical protein